MRKYPLTESKAQFMGTAIDLRNLSFREDVEALCDMLGLPYANISDKGKKFAKEPDYGGGAERWFEVEDPKLDRPMIAARMLAAMNGEGGFEYNADEKFYYWVPKATDAQPVPPPPVAVGAPTPQLNADDILNRIAKLELAVAMLESR